MLDGMSDSIQRSMMENLHSREVDRQSPTGLIFLQDHYCERNSKNLEKDKGNCDRETRKGPKTGGKLPPNICLAHATCSGEIAALVNRLQH